MSVMQAYRKVKKTHFSWGRTKLPSTDNIRNYLWSYEINVLYFQLFWKCATPDSWHWDSFFFHLVQEYYNVLTSQPCFHWLDMPCRSPRMPTTSHKAKYLVLFDYQTFSDPMTLQDLKQIQMSSLFQHRW